jgi:hypothetical protein
MDRDDEEIVGENIHLLGPPLHGCVALLRQVGVEEGGEGV